MSKEKIHTIPSLLNDSPVHQAALTAGKDHFRAWNYNVIDEFKSKTVEEIRQTLRETCHPFAVLAENIIGDMNISTLMRNMNVFNLREMFYVGNKRYDRRGNVGVTNYSDIKWLSTLEEVKQLQDQYTLIAIDNTPGSIDLSEFKFEPNMMFVFGEEGCGLTPTIQSLCKQTVKISQFGSVRSLNVGVASGIILYEAVKQYRACSKAI